MGAGVARPRPLRKVARITAALPVLLAAGWLAHARGRAPAGGPAPRVIVDAALLTGPGDAPPKLVAGAPVPAPADAPLLTPTVMCRIVVDERGHVEESRVGRPRPDLAPFERAAVAAVRDYRFEPARRAGAAVASSLPWVVTFTP